MTALVTAKKTLSFALLSLVVSGCNTVKVESFEEMKGTQAELVHLKPGADFSRYHKLLPMPLEIRYSSKIQAPTDETLKQIRQAFRQAFNDHISGDYQVVSKPAHDVLKIHASVLDLKTNQTTNTSQFGGILKTLVQPGKLTFLIELQDSLTNEILLRAGDTEPPTATEEKAQSTRSEIDAAANRWVKMLRRFLDANLGSQI